jgi:hypothetical protein
MVELYLKGKVENMVKGQDFKNKETGEVKKGVLKLQFLILDKMRGLQTLDLSVPEEFENKAISLKGKEVELPVSLYAKNSNIYYKLKEI